MALRTNSKKAAENIYNYIREYSEDYLQDNYSIDPATIESKAGLYQTIYDIFRQEMRPDNSYYSRYPEVVVFGQWASGLAMGGLFCYYYNREAVKDLAGILEETEAESAKFTEDKAEDLLTGLIYREIKKEVNKA